MFDMPDYVQDKIQENERFLSKFQGCLIGGAIGDALGYPVEFMSAQEIRSKFGKQGIMAYQLDNATGKALISDDTQMTLFTANAILIGDTRQSLRGISGNAACYARHTYLDWLHTQDPYFTDNPGDSWLLTVPELYCRRAPGNTCLQALHEGAQGSTEHPANNSKGCGGIMRVAPAGLYFKDPKAAADQASELAAVTHGHPLGYISAAAFAYIVNRCTYGSILDAEDPAVAFREMLRTCAAYMRTMYPNHPHAAAYVGELMDKAYELAISDIDEVNAIAQLGEGWVAEETLAIAVFSAVRHLGDFSAAVRCAVNHGGDSDSTCAVCGNIVGALLGMKGIGSKWTRALELHDVILEIAKDLCDRCQMSEWGDWTDDAWMAKYGQTCVASLAINRCLRESAQTGAEDIAVEEAADAPMQEEAVHEGIYPAQPIQALPLLGITEDNAETFSIRLNNVMSHLNPWELPRKELYDHLFRYKWSDKEKNRVHAIKGKKVFQFLNLNAGEPLFVFMGAFEIGDVKTVEDGGGIYEWKGREDLALAPLARRLVVRYVRDPGYQGMDFRLNYDKFLDSFLSKMTVEYIRQAPFEVQPFPGYDNVLLTHRGLVAAVCDEQWKTMLDNVQAVYLQTDTSNGWHYVGSAYGKGKMGKKGLLSRWTDYAFGDHTGGNALLKAIPNAREHIERHFQYSILEVFDMKTDAETIIRREHWWMRALDSVRDAGRSNPHGYNSF